MTVGAEVVSRNETGALRYRTATAAIGLPVVAGAIWLGGPLLALLAGAVGVISAFEIRRLLPGSNRLVLGPVIILAAALAWLAYGGSPLWPHLALGLCAAAVLLSVGSKSGPTPLQHFKPWATAIVGPLYPAAFLSFGLAIHALPFGEDPFGTAVLGRDWLLFALLLVFASDTSAYFVGRSIGRRRLAPLISPGKTWEGAIGALIGASLISSSLSVVLPIHADQLLGLNGPATFTAFAVIGLGVSVLAQSGDLFESALKRSAGAKESGGLLPGHGGFLDRLDSILPVLPAVYYGLLWVS